MDYTYFYKDKFKTIDEINVDINYDLFISFNNGSSRVIDVFEGIDIAQKVLIYDEADLFTLKCLNFKITGNELDDVKEFISKFPIKGKKLCFDITGFPTQYIFIFLKFFQKEDLLSFDAIYSEPDYYVKKSNTIFTDEFVGVRQIELYRGQHSTDESNDYLIINSGYDHISIIEVCKHKENVHKKIQLLGFPSLQPDMYQENILKIHSAKNVLNFENIHDSELNLFAPANDPFATAQELSMFIKKCNDKKEITNIYLSPLSTKAQALGFGLYYIWENCNKKPISVIFPYCNKVHKKTSYGLSKISVYHVELPKL